MSDKTEELTLDKLISLDKPSIYALGLLASKILQKAGKVVLAVDVLNRVQLMPPSAVEWKIKPKIDVLELDKMKTDVAIRVMIAQGDSENDIMQYLKNREGRQSNAI